MNKPYFPDVPELIEEAEQLSAQGRGDVENLIAQRIEIAVVSLLKGEDRVAGLRVVASIVQMLRQ